MSQIDLDEVRFALTPSRVLEYYAWTTKRSGNDLESRACPIRSDHSRRALVLTPGNGLWKCHACDEGGDMFDFVALREGLQIDVEFPAVLAKAAEIAGVVAGEENADERRRRQDEWKRQRKAEQEREREERIRRDAEAVPTATSYWMALENENAAGSKYLAERGIAEVLKFPGTVRFDPRHGGSPALALHSSDGKIRNVVNRRLPELGEPKTPGLRACPTAGTFGNSVRDISLNRNRDVVLVEGVADSATAVVAWPGALVLGAHGAANLPKIAKLAAPAVVASGGRLLVVPHEDERGFYKAREACEIAIAAGLSARRGTLRVIGTGAKDLNDAWRHGWRPSA